MTSFLANPKTGSVTLFAYPSDGKFFDIGLPLPANAPRPDGKPAGTASIINLRGLNDFGQFVGAYSRVVEWGIDIFGNFGPTKFEIGNFIATPQKPDKKN